VASSWIPPVWAEFRSDAHFNAAFAFSMLSSARIFLKGSRSTLVMSASQWTGFSSTARSMPTRRRTTERTLGFRRNFARRSRWADDSLHSRNWRGQCGHSASATHDLLLRSNPCDGDPLSSCRGRGQLCGLYLTVRSDGFVGGLRRGLTENLRA
jgi:hypothetical protein